MPVASWKGELGKSAHRWQADADASPSPGAASFLASPLRSWLCVSGSEVLLEEAGLHPKMLSATQISCQKKRVPAAHLPASSLLPLFPPPFPPLLPSSSFSSPPLPSFLPLPSPPLLSLPPSSPPSFFLTALPFFPSSFHKLSWSPYPHQIQSKSWKEKDE